MEEDRLNQAIQYSQHGNKDEARKILLDLIQENSGNEAAWLWLVDVCDSDDERKAILRRGLQINPNSQLLRQALSHFHHTGALDANYLKKQTSSLVLRSEKPKERTPERKAVKKQKPPEVMPTLDLDWLGRDEEISTPRQADPVEAEGLATISDEEFSKLSEAFFDQGNAEQKGKPVSSFKSEPESANSFFENQLPVMSGMDSLDVLREEQQEEPVQKKRKEKKPDAIEDELKKAFIDALPQEEKTRKLQNFFKNNSRRLILIFGSFFWLMVLVILGIYLVRRFDLFSKDEPDGNAVAVTEATFIPTENQDDESVETATPQAEMTQTTEVPAEAIEATPVQTKIELNSLGSIGFLDTLPSAGWTAFNKQLSVFTSIESGGVVVYDMDGAEKVTLTSSSSTPITAVEFNQDGSKMLGFAPSLDLYLWDIDYIRLLRMLDVPEDYKTLLSEAGFNSQLAKPTLAISPDQSKAALGYWGGVFVWTIEDGVLVFSSSKTSTELISLASEKNLSYSVSFSKSGDILYYGGGKQIAAYNLAEDVELWKVWTSQILCVESLPSERIIEAGYKENDPANTQYIRVRDELSGKILAEYSWDAGIDSGHSGPVYSYLPEAERLLVSVDGVGGLSAVAIIDGLSGTQIGTIALDSTLPIYAISEVPEQNLAAVWYVPTSEALTSFGQVGFFDLETGAAVGYCETCTLKPIVNPDQHSMVITADGENLVLCASGYGCAKFGLPQE